MRLSRFTSLKLDYIRGLAALFVVLGHTRGAYFESFHNLLPAYQTLITKTFYAFTRIGHQCVIVFFVLSGFLVGGLSLKNFLEGNLSLKDYFSKRITRIYIVVIPTLIIGGYLNYITGLTNNLEIEYFFGNLFHLQTVFFPTYGSNGPLWSLANEFWYYTIFMTIIFYFKKIRNKNMAIILSITTFSFFAYIMPNIIAYLMIWILGLIIPFLKNRLPRLNDYIYLIFKFSFIPLIIIFNIYGGYISDLIFAFYTAILLTYMIKKNKHVKSYMPLIKLSKFSFSLYAIHYPVFLYILYLSSGFLSFQRYNYLNLENLLGYVLINIVVLIFSYVFYLLFEKHTTSLRYYLNKKIF